MLNLDDLNAVAEIDKSNQLGILSKWSSLVTEARKESLLFNLPKDYTWKSKTTKYVPPKTIVVCGMGGSAVAGDYLASLLKDELEIPIIVNREYKLPLFVNQDTLVICVSYSGNTEETLSCFYDALKKEAMLVTISSGGLLGKLSIQIDIPYIKIKEGIPPRTALPLIYISILSIFEKYDFIKNLDNEINEIEELLNKLSTEYSVERETNSNLPKQLALGLYNTLPIFVGHSIYSPVAYRAKCELNENSKLLAISEDLPEQNHNSIVAWDNPTVALNDVTVVLFREKDEQKSIKIRIEEFKKIVNQKTEKVLEIYPEGNSNLAKQFTTTYLVDLVSVYLAILYEIDPSITPGIDNLKAVLKKKTDLQTIIEKEIS